MLRCIIIARSWPVVVRIAIATTAVAAATTLQLPVEIEVPGEPFLLNFVVVVVSACVFGRTSGFVAVAETSIASALYFEPFYSLKLTHAIHLLAIEIYAVVAALSVEAFCRFVEGALAEKTEASSARIQRKEAQGRLAEREGQLALFIEHVPAAIAMFDDKMRYLAVSRRFLSDYQLPAAAEVIGRSHYEIFPDIPQRWRKIHARVLAGEELCHEGDPFLGKDGRFERVQWWMAPWRTADGEIGGALLFTQFMTRTLADSETRFRATFENAAVGIAHVAPDGRWLRVNEALCRILGYPDDELLTKTFQDVTHPDDLAGEVAQVELIRKGKIDSYDVDKRYLRKDGSIVWGRKTVGCVRKGDGSIDYLVSVIEDISARKVHEEQVHLLMHEVNHRAKNMLSLVQAIARQTAAREPEDFIERFTDRIQALAANQDLLIRNEWQGVDVEDLVHAQLAHFADLVGSRIAMHGPKLHLNATAAQAIGLALHELSTNAGKYGALSVDAGCVDVCWRLDGDVFAMSWTERNGPPVSPPERRGFGSTVVDSMVYRTLDGDVQLDFAPSGVVWHLTCPVANALERR